MAAVTLYDHRTEVVTNGVAAGPVLEDNELLNYASTTADTLSLPKGTAVGFAVRVLNTGTQTITITAQTGETVTGGVSIPTGDILTLSKNGSTTWVGALVGTNLTA